MISLQRKPKKQLLAILQLSLDLRVNIHLMDHKRKQTTKFFLILIA